MPTNLFMGDTEFPKFKEGQSSDEKIDAILDYLRLMQEQLRYTLAHVGDSNINTKDISGLIKTVNKPVITVVENSEKKMQSEISQMADSIKLSVDNDGEEISITLSVGEDGKSTITLGGLVTFTSLEDDGEVTTINGAEINTGTINGVIFNGCQFNCSNNENGSVNFVDSSDSALGSMYVYSEDGNVNRYLTICTADGAIGSNVHILLSSNKEIHLNAADGVYVNGTKIG